MEEVYRKIIFRHAQGEHGKKLGYYMEQKEKKRRKKKSNRGAYYDYNLLAIVILLICFGLIMLYSTSAYEAQMKFHGDDMYYFRRQALISRILLER